MSYSSSSYNIDYVTHVKSFQNLKGHKNRMIGSKVTAILLNRWIWPIGRFEAGRVCTQPAKHTCFPLYGPGQDQPICKFSHTSDGCPSKQARYNRNFKLETEIWNYHIIIVHSLPYCSELIIVVNDHCRIVLS